MYTLKVDWKRPRIAAVTAVLFMHAESGAEVEVTKPLYAEFLPMLDTQYAQEMTEQGATIKLDLSPAQLDVLEVLLAKAVTAGLQDLAELSAAMQEIRIYRVNAEQ